MSSVMVDWLQKIHRAIRGEDRANPFATAPHTTTSDRVLTATSDKIGIDGTLVSLDLQAVPGQTAPRRGETLVRLSLLDESGRERATLANGYYDGSGRAIGGNGALSVKAGDRIQIQSWSVVVVILRAVGYILPNVQRAGGWNGVSENSLEGRGRLVLNADETLNDSDKAITVPANARLGVRSIWIEYTATSVVGTRVVDVRLRDAADDIVGGYRLWPAAVTASQTGRAWLFPEAGGGRAAQDVLRSTLADGATHSDMGPWPDTDLPAAFDLQFIDTAAIDAAADDMILQVLTEEWIEE